MDVTGWRRSPRLSPAPGQGRAPQLRFRPNVPNGLQSLQTPPHARLRVVRPPVRGRQGEWDGRFPEGAEDLRGATCRRFTATGDLTRTEGDAGASLAGTADS